MPPGSRETREARIISNSSSSPSIEGGTAFYYAERICDLRILSMVQLLEKHLSRDVFPEQVTFWDNRKQFFFQKEETV